MPSTSIIWNQSSENSWLPLSFTQTVVWYAPTGDNWSKAAEEEPSSPKRARDEGDDWDFDNGVDE